MKRLRSAVVYSTAVIDVLGLTACFARSTGKWSASLVSGDAGGFRFASSLLDLLILTYAKALLIALADVHVRRAACADGTSDGAKELIRPLLGGDGDAPGDASGGKAGSESRPAQHGGVIIGAAFVDSEDSDGSNDDAEDVAAAIVESSTRVGRARRAVRGCGERLFLALAAFVAAKLLTRLVAGVGSDAPPSEFFWPCIAWFMFFAALELRLMRRALSSKTDSGRDQGRDAGAGQSAPEPPAAAKKKAGIRDILALCAPDWPLFLLTIAPSRRCLSPGGAGGGVR